MKQFGSVPHLAQALLYSRLLKEKRKSNRIMLAFHFSIIFSCLSLVFCLEDHCPAWPEVVDVTCGSDGEDLVEVNKGPNHQGLDDQEKRFQLVLLRNWLVLAAAVVGAVVASVAFMATARPPPEPVFRPQRAAVAPPVWNGADAVSPARLLGHSLGVRARDRHSLSLYAPELEKTRFAIVGLKSPPWHRNERKRRSAARRCIRRYKASDRALSLAQRDRLGKAIQRLEAHHSKPNYTGIACKIGTSCGHRMSAWRSWGGTWKSTSNSTGGTKGKPKKKQHSKGAIQTWPTLPSSSGLFQGGLLIFAYGVA